MNTYTDEMKKELDYIEKLISTPNIIRDHAINSLKNFKDSDLKNTEQIKLKNAIQSIENISNKSINKSYGIIYNQICILAVSALSAVLEKYFINMTKQFEKIRLPNDLKISLYEIKEYEFDMKKNLGNIILKKDNSINFQDLKSVLRAYEKYFNKNIKLDDELKNNIIFYQQCRHVLVHKNGIVDEDFIQRIKNCNIKKYKKKNKIQLNKNDWEKIKKYFCSFMNKLDSE